MFGYKSKLQKSREEQYKEKGWVYCHKHPGKWYDPEKYSHCYLCHLEEQKKSSEVPPAKED